MATVQEIKNMADRTLAAIAAESDRDDSIIALVNGNTSIITSLKEQLAAALANGANPDELQAVLDAVTAAESSALANAAKVNAAVEANLPGTVA